MKRFFILILTFLGYTSFAQTNVWSAKANFGGVDRYLATGFSIGSKVYVGTGTDVVGTFIGKTDFWEYDVTGNTWTQKANFGGTGRFSAVGFAIDGKGYIGMGIGTGALTAFKDLWQYNPTNNTWTQKADMDGVARGGAVAFVVAGKAYVGTGQNTSSANLADFYEYDPIANDWAQKSNMPGTTRYFATAFSIGSKGYVGTGSDESNNTLDDFYEYTPASNAWTQKATFEGGARSNAVGFSIAGKGYLGTGSDLLTKKDFWEYNPSTNDWTQKADFGGTARMGAVGMSAAGKGFIGTGLVTDVTKDFYVYTPAIEEGQLYGAAAGGGMFNYGTIYKASSTGTGVTALRNFNSDGGGNYPSTYPLAVNRSIYGMTSSGGINDYGIMYRYNIDEDDYDNLVEMAMNGSNGSLTGLTFADGKLYGMAGAGGLGPNGYLFVYDIFSGVFQRKADFNGTNGSQPAGGLTLYNGKLYGMTSKGGSSDNGVIFEYNYKTNVLTKKADFDGTNGLFVAGSLTEANGKLYGLSPGGGSAGAGTLFEFDPVTNAITVKKNFSGSDGENPRASLTAMNGFLYGTASAGGDIFKGLAGTLFQFEPTSGNFLKLFDFSDDGSTGTLPWATLTAVNGKLYGTTFSNGANSRGTLFEYDFSEGFTKKFDFTSTSGSNEYWGMTFVHDNQTINFSALAAKTVGDAPFTVSATSTSDLPITFTSTNENVATVSGTTVTIVGAGTTKIYAYVGRDNDFTIVNQDLTVNKHSQAISFTQPDPKTFGDAAFDLDASSDSGLGVTLSADDPTVATISGNTVTIVGAGSTVITASQLGNSNYAPAADVTHTLTVSTLAQTITFAPLPSKAIADGDFDLTATASSGLTVTYESSNTAVATISGNTVHLITPGTIDITAKQAGNASVDPATDVVRSLTVVNQGQTITFDPLTPKLINDPPFILLASASSTLNVTLISSDTDVATISGHTLTIVGAGTTDITATQEGNSLFAAAPPVTRTLTVSKLFQSINFPTISNKAVGDVFDLATTTSAGLSITYESSNTSVATISGHTVTVVGNGTTTITASQLGDDTYDVAASVDQELSVKIGQGITFAALAEMTIGDPTLSLTGSSSSGLALTYTSSNPGVASVTGSTLTINAIGSTLITATQTGNNDYYSATPVSRLLTVANVGNQAPETQGEIWGVSSWGGKANLGFVYKTNADGTGYSVVSEFETDPDGAHPRGTLTKASNGKLYGVAQEGGVNNGGVLFEFDPATGTYGRKMDFGFHTNVGSTLGAGPDGKLYGTFDYGITSFLGYSGIFEYDIDDNAITQTFHSPDLIFPNSILLKSGNNYYGFSYGTNNIGAIFKYDATANIATKLVEFDVANGTQPVAMIFGDTDEIIYGVTNSGGVNNNGVIFELNLTTNTLTKKFDFENATSGAAPVGIMKASNGKIYGQARIGGQLAAGTIFEYDPATNTVTTKSKFRPTDYIGYPNGNLIEGDGGKLLGTYSYDVTHAGIFEFDPVSETLDVKAIQLIADGQTINGSMLPVDGKLYGLTYDGGAHGGGVLFEYDVANDVYSRKYDFSLASAGAYPRGKLTQATDGMLYGVTTAGGTTNVGTIYQVDPATGLRSLKASFSAETGTSPVAGLELGLDGILYGITPQGGTNFYGTIYQFDPNAIVNALLLRTELNPLTMGYFSSSKLTLAQDGKLWGMTHYGAPNAGAIIAYDPSTGAATGKFSFDLATGGNPFGSLLLASNGKFYGMTSEGGANNGGVLFEFDPSDNTYEVKQDFPFGISQKGPDDTPIEINGKIYGVTRTAGTNNAGTLFEYDITADVYTVKVDFAVGSDGPSGLVRAANGNIYGVTSAGGTNARGFLFEYNPETNAFTNKTSFVTSLDEFHVQNPLMQIYTSSKTEQTITFESIDAVTMGATPLTLVATATSSLNVVFTTDGDKVTIAGNTAAIVKPGSVTIHADQPGNATYRMAARVDQTFCINPAKPTISISLPDTEHPVLTSSAGAGNQWFLNGDPLEGETNITLTIDGVGIYTVQATVDECASEISEDTSLVITGDINSHLAPSLTIYPNPTANELHVQWPYDGKGNQSTRELTIYDVLGRKITTKTMTSEDLTIDVQQLNGGTYILKGVSGNMLHQQRFIKN